MSVQNQPLTGSTESCDEVGTPGSACRLNPEGKAVPGDCGCCGMSGRGGKLRIGLLIAVFVVVVVLMVHGFMTAG